jgi:hypothetical protein
VDVTPVNSGGELPVISSATNLKFLPIGISELELIDLLSDVKHRVFPRSFERLSKLRGDTDLVGAEIGVAGGEHALSMLETLDIKRLYLIDPYAIYEGYEEGKAHYGVDQKPLSDTEVLAQEKLKRHSKKIVWIKKLSTEAVKIIEENLDFVYIDGNHQEEYVTEDIENYYPLVRKGGVIGGHDYYNGWQREHDGVIRAATSFAVSRNLELRVELPDWWIEV